MRKSLSFLGISFAVLLFSCASPGPTAGGGSEGEARVACVVHAIDGSAAANVSVHLRRSDYVTPTPSLAKASIIGADAMTDDRGRFEIAGIAPGTYRIEADNGTSACMIACTLSTGDQRDFGNDTLQAYAAITGAIDTTGRAGERIYAQVEGLDRLVQVRTDGSFVIDGLPAGTHAVHLIAEGQTDPIAVASGITVPPGQVESVVLASGWRYAKRLYINTTAAGANVAEDVMGFPLLVRPFECGVRSGECGVRGEDIRFVKSDGSALPYEIERWDSASSLAEVWVRVDTIYGNSDTQWILMVWGASTALRQAQSDSSATPSLSSSSAVFDTAEGYAGVWHFASDSPTRDATANRNDAIDSGTVSTASIIGTARGFDGASYMYIPDTATLEPASITISAWVNVAEFISDLGFTKILQKGQSGYEPKFGSYTLELRPDTVTGKTDLPGFQTTNTDSTYHYGMTRDPVPASTWMLLTGTFDAITGTGCLYLDGVPQQTFTALAPIDYYPDTLYPVTIGCQFGSGSATIAPQCLFKGLIDEVRISTRPRSPAWVRLEYENQKSGSTLLECR